MDNDSIQKKCEVFLKELQVPGYIFFAWEKPEKKPDATKDYGFVFAAHEFPPPVAMKGHLWAMDQLVSPLPKTE